MFKFADIEGFDAELAEKLDSDSAVASAMTAYIDESVNNRVDVVKGDFKSKMDALNAKKVAAEEHAAAFGDITPEEIKSLRAASGKAEEYTATLAEKDKIIAEKEKQIGDVNQKLQGLQLSTTIASAINEYDAKNPTVTVKPDMKDLIGILANDVLKLDENTGQFRVYDKSGNIVATDKGAASPVDWLNILRSERPSLFNAPTGGGASGSKHPGSAKKFADMNEAERVALYRENPSEFKRLKGAD